MVKILEIKKDYGGWRTKSSLHHFKTVYKDLREAKNVARANGYDAVGYFVGVQRPKRKIIKV